MNPASPQPEPISSQHRKIVDLVIDDIYQRSEAGIKKYGVPLQGFNGRDWLIDAYQEALDHAMYLRQGIFERDNSGAEEMINTHFDLGMALSRIAALETQADQREKELKYFLERHSALLKEKDRLLQHISDLECRVKVLSNVIQLQQSDFYELTTLVKNHTQRLDSLETRWALTESDGK